MENESKSFWSTIPGLLTGLAGLITAITGLILIFHNPGSVNQNPYRGDTTRSISDNNPPTSSTDLTRTGTIVIPGSVSTPTLEDKNVLTRGNEIRKIIGQWKFTWYSNLSGNTLTGTLSLEANESSGENDVKGHMETDSKDWLSFSGDVKGIFSNNLLTLTRPTGVKDIIQYYSLTYDDNSGSFAGSFTNGDAASETYKDQGTLMLRR
ncbi:hypothetical protein GZH53_09050 [Flavihumibacter sp. R14]|nr:hypothetical protein [Flavihumibacter soli]